jgi:6-phosphogluconolactonase
MSTISVSKDLGELSTKAAAEFVRIAHRAIEERGQFSVALSGGSTPKALHAKLVGEKINWSKVFFFFGDERNVPPNHQDSNFRMADETLFGPLGISSNNIRRWQTEKDTPEAVAAKYSNEIDVSAAPPSPAYTGGYALTPQFDLVLLGIGSDGHTASLFPHTKALQETAELAVANWVPQLDTWRYTLTFPVINNAANIMFLAAGADKAETLKEVIEGERRPDDLPAQSVHPVNGELFWFIDEAAGSLLG